MVSATANSPNSMGSTRKELVRMARRTMLRTWAISPLARRERRKEDRLNRCPQVVDDQFGKLVAPVVRAQKFFIVDFSDDQAVQVVEQRIDQRRK